MIEKYKIGCCGFPVARQRYFAEFSIMFNNVYMFEDAIRLRRLLGIRQPDPS